MNFPSKNVWQGGRMLCFLMLSLLCCRGNSRPMQKIDDSAPYSKFRAGYIANSYLFCYVPQSLERTTQMLAENHPAQALPDIEKIRAEKPDNLIVLICYAQAKSPHLQNDIAELEKQHAAKPNDLNLSAKLATVLYYQCLGSPVLVPDTQAKREVRLTTLKRVHTLLLPAWEKSHELGVGLLMEDNNNIVGLGLFAKQIAERLLQEYGWKKIFTAYETAKRKRWNVKPPPLTLVPERNKFALCGIVQILYGLTTVRTGTVHRHGNKAEIEYPPLSTEQQREHKYLSQWLSNMEKGKD